MTLPRVVRIYDNGWRLAYLVAEGRKWWQYISHNSTGKLTVRARKYDSDEETGEKVVPWRETEHDPEAFRTLLVRRGRKWGMTKDAKGRLKKGGG